ncbi:hypothetical protein FE257_009991 [Aspergillus nanangensis]|uniref:NTP binding protein n=1 Tax=Aspergillus nanangensis TaxID=2582783 RepID=A0AAD4CW67_ASPNN|nr:hypothetical protein FE257_009991 [Aspergillus nanangensis]
MEEYLSLPNGHLLNLQPRPQHGRRGRATLSSEEKIASGHEQESAIDERPVGSESRSTNSSTSTTPLRRGKQTKLPMPKTLADRSKDLQDLSLLDFGHEGKLEHTPPRPSDFPQTPGHETTPPTDKDREQSWRKVREMFDKDNNSSAKDSKDKQKGHYQDAYRKILSLANSSKQEIAKQKLKYTGGPDRSEKLPTNSSSRSKIPSPRANNNRPSPGGKPETTSPSHAASRGKPRLSRDRKLSLDTREVTPRRSADRADNATDSSIQSYTSISPVSGPDSSITEWEDRFVVNMPSAREPNPPIMNDDQISDFQKSIEKVHKEGGAMLDPDTLPSPRTRTPEEKFEHTEQHTKPTGTLDGQESRSGSSGEANDRSPTEYEHRRYYSPDEIGKQRFSTIWEEGPSKIKRQDSDLNADGSFLGCKEINGPNDKNPDEILLFSTCCPTDERPRIIDASSPVSRIPRDWKQATTCHVKPPVEPKNTLQEERTPNSQNSKTAQCSKPLPKTMCQESKCQQPENTGMLTESRGKENTACTGGLTRSRPVQKKRGDDVFIITPTITRTLVPMDGATVKATRTKELPPILAAGGGENVTDTRGGKPQMIPTPSGLRRATQHSWVKSGIPSKAPSKPGHLNDPLGARTETEPLISEKSRAIRGFIRMPGMVKSSTENFGGRIRTKDHTHHPLPPTPKDDNLFPVRRASDTPRCVSPINPSSTDRPDHTNTMRNARVVEVAELDGLQLSDPTVNQKAIYNQSGNDEPKLSGVKSSALNVDLKIRSESHSVSTSPRQVLSPLTWSLIMNILALSAAQARGIYKQITAGRKSRMDLVKNGVDCVLGMMGHCLNVFKDILYAFSVYNSTGSWPQNNERDLFRSMADIGQAVVYLVALGFMMMIVGRAAGYVVLIGTWIVWFTKPFGWVLGALAKVLLA